MLDSVIREFKDFDKGVEYYKKVKQRVKMEIKSQGHERKRDTKANLKKTKFASLL
jgi:hypothetical protein